MNTEFSRIITLLRKEKKLSQKQVAKDLGISQALLSHYEKGIRECGLDFIIKTSEYYGVSCDYLLGKTIERNGAKISFDDISNSEASVNYGSLLSQLNKKLIQNSTNLLFDVAESTHNRNCCFRLSYDLCIQNVSHTLFFKLPEPPSYVLSS